MMVDLSEWVRNRIREDITCSSGVSGEDENGRRMVDFCAERVFGVST